MMKQNLRSPSEDVKRTSQVTPHWRGWHGGTVERFMQPVLYLGGSMDSSRVTTIETYPTSPSKMLNSGLGHEVLKGQINTFRGRNRDRKTIDKEF